MHGPTLCVSWDIVMFRFPKRIKWLTFYVFNLKRNLHGFWADLRSFSDPLCSFSEYCKLYKFVSLYNVRVGKCTYFAEKTIVSNCTIGAFCSIGPQVLIGLGVHPLKWISTHPSFYSTANQSGIQFTSKNKLEEHKETFVGNDVWIGAKSIILDGVIVGDGAVIAAGSVVSKDVPPYSIVGGVPAKIIKHRFKKDVIDQLLLFKWWDYPVEQIKRISHSFIEKEDWCVEDIEELERTFDRL